MASSPWIPRLLAGCLSLVLGAAAASADSSTGFYVRAFNDVLSGAERSDDLYTAGLTLGGEVGRWSFTLGEFMFTDRDADLRFDETYALAAVRLPGTAGWEVVISGGALHTGRGLLGQNVQNEIHDLTGDAPLDLNYVGGDEMHAATGLRVGYPLRVSEKLQWEPRIDLFTADGFRRHAMVATDVRLRLRPRTSLLCTAGVRFSDTDFAPLEPHLAPSAPVVEIGVLYRGFLSATWSYNRFGTEEPHLHLAGRWTWPRPSDPADGMSAGGETFYP